MSQVSEEEVKNALKRIVDPDSGKDMISAGLVSGISIRDGDVGFVITIDPRDREFKAHLRHACEASVKQVPGVGSVTAVMTGEAPATQPPPEVRKPAQWNNMPLEHVKKIIAVASGKGGVGKSTTAVNIALALVRMGKRAGLLDADIYGPSIPRMMGLTGQPEIQGGKMIPLASHGVATMSMGFITGDQAAVLRGPMISKALAQMLRMTRWGTAEAPLDALIVDMPPGTGDIHLSMAQQAPLSGAVIVTTPQEVAVADARKCLIMFRKVNVPVLGVIENMGGELFGSGGGRKMADDMGAPLLGEIPADMAIREAADGGKVYDGKYAPAYDAIAKKLLG